MSQRAYVASVHAAFARHPALQRHDQSRFGSPALTRAFASVIRLSSLGPQSEMSVPDEITLH